MTTTLENKMNGVLIERTASGCELKLEIKSGEYIWNMFSSKTGTHSIRQSIEKGSGAPRPNARVRAHWDGFIQNQNK
jgi:hypothetical protein